MPNSGLTPLDPVTWFDSLRRLKKRALVGPGNIESDLRLAYYLASLAPSSFGLVANARIDERRFEALLGGGTFDAAAVTLIGSELSYQVSSSPGEPSVTARVWVNDMAAQVDMAGSCVACALLQAWLELLLRFEPEYVDWPNYASQRSA